MDACALQGQRHVEAVVHAQLAFHIDPCAVLGDRVDARVLGRHYEVEVLDELLLAARDAEKVQAHTGAYVLRAPMPGLVVHVQAEAGKHVKAGDALVIMEAMKMRNELLAEVAGVVNTVAVAVGDKVDSQAALVTITRE